MKVNKFLYLQIIKCLFLGTALYNFFSFAIFSVQVFLYFSFVLMQLFAFCFIFFSDYALVGVFLLLYTIISYTIVDDIIMLCMIFYITEAFLEEGTSITVIFCSIAFLYVLSYSWNSSLLSKWRHGFFFSIFASLFFA